MYYYFSVPLLPASLFRGSADEVFLHSFLNVLFMFLKHISRKLCAINLIFLCVLGGGEKTEEKKVQIPQAAHTYINKDS